MSPSNSQDIEPLARPEGRHLHESSGFSCASLPCALKGEPRGSVFAAGLGLVGRRRRRDFADVGRSAFNPGSESGSVTIRRSE
jgi:hypothetical protein